MDAQRTPWDNLILRFVRNRAQMEVSDIKALLNADVIDKTVRSLQMLQRDVELQFVSSDARLAELRANCRIARANGKKFFVPSDDKEELAADAEAGEWMDPKVAEDLLYAREMRWKVRTTRFFHLIEDALYEATKVARVASDENIRTLIEAILEHRIEVGADADDIDGDLYKVVDKVLTTTG